MIHACETSNEMWGDEQRHREKEKTEKLNGKPESFYHLDIISFSVDHVCHSLSQRNGLSTKEMACFSQIRYLLIYLTTGLDLISIWKRLTYINWLFQFQFHLMRSNMAWYAFNKQDKPTNKQTSKQDEKRNLKQQHKEEKTPNTEINLEKMSWLLKWSEKKEANHKNLLKQIIAANETSPICLAFWYTKSVCVCGVF